MGCNCKGGCQCSLTEGDNVTIAGTGTPSDPWVVSSTGGAGSQGPQGFQGATGSGTQGAQGFQGGAGAQGSQGFQGGVGAQGSQGFQGGVGGGSPVMINNQTASYVAAVTDIDKIIEMEVASANTLTINNSVFVVGDEFEVVQTGAGQTTLTPGAGVTIRFPGGRNKIAEQWGVATIYARSASEFVAVGDLST